MHTMRRCFILPKFLLEVLPEMFNMVEIRGLGWPPKDIKVVVLKPLVSPLGVVFGVIVPISLLPCLRFFLTIPHYDFYSYSFICPIFWFYSQPSDCTGSLSIIAAMSGTPICFRVFDCSADAISSDLPLGLQSLHDVI